MRIIFLCKRQYMSKDVILDKYARLYEIPHQLALLGHDVTCFCLSYQHHENAVWEERKNLKWYSFNKRAILNYRSFILKKTLNNPPDIIISASDIPHTIFGAWLAKRLNCHFIADLYDNFESYGQAKIPFLKTLFKNALNTSSIIITTSMALAQKIKKEHPKVPHIIALPSVIDKKIFYKGNKKAARKKLNLPSDANLIGTAGGLTKMKGIEDLFNAWSFIKKEQSNTYLVLAGPIEKKTALPQGNNVIYLGKLPHKEINLLFQALDIGIVCIPNNDFGKYCFPQKAYEMLATNLRIVSSRIGDMSELLPKEYLYTVDKPKELASKVMCIEENRSLDVHIPDWKETINKLNNLLETLC